MKRAAHDVAPLLAGWRERIALPDLGLPPMRAKIDTGARTTALHAQNIRETRIAGQDWVAFDAPGRNGTAIACRAPLIEWRDVKNTSGVPEPRPVIRTTLVFGDRSWPIEVTLADRGPMRFDIILGRTAFAGQRVLIDPQFAYLATRRRPKRTRSRKETTT